jgi:small subunit ribosomal protein S3
MEGKKMGQKVNPHGLRVGVIKDWDSKWFATKKNFCKFLVEDYKIRKFLKGKLYESGVSRIEISRDSNKIRINIHCAKPGRVIGTDGKNIEKLQLACDSLVNQQKGEKKLVFINVAEVKNVDKDAQLVAEWIALQLEKRASFRRVMKQSIQRTMSTGAQGIKIILSGRLGGAEIARKEHYDEGTIPLHTLRADIDYGFAEAQTTYGKIGVKVLIYKGEVLKDSSRKHVQEERGRA